MEVHWQDGELWLSSDLYEGPSELLLFFAERGKVPLTQLTLSDMIQTALRLLEALPLEDRLSVLLFFAHLSRLKAHFLLPTAEPEPDTLVSPTQAAAGLSNLPLVWLAERIATYSYRVARLSEENLPTKSELLPISPWKLLQAYQAVLARQEQAQTTYQVAPPPIRLELVEHDLQGRFAREPYQTLKALWQSLPAISLYRVAALLILLNWIAEGKLQYKASSLWDGVLEWVA